MSSDAFHPALVGILYGDLAQYEQLLAEAAIAASLTRTEPDSDDFERHLAIVAGLKRLIALAEPGPQGAPIEAIEKKRRAYVVLGRLQELLPEFDISWNLHYNKIEATLLPWAGNDEVRKGISVMADRLGIDYIERRHGSSGTTLIVCAKGEIEGIPVRIYDLIEAERPICDTHHVMVDDAGACPQCPVSHGASIACSESPCPICVEQQEQNRQAAAELAGDAP